MTPQETLDRLYELVKKDGVLRQKLLATKDSDNSVSDFCHISTEYGYPIAPFDLIMAGEEAYAEMCRSTNGGGENHPRIQGADDLYGLFILSIQ